nr:NUDIX hydrolase [Piscibacillus halophilus]
MKKWETISEYIYKTPFGNLRKDRCEMPDGKVIDSYYVHEYSDWVNAVVLTKNNQIILVNQYRHAGGDSFLEIPAGKIEVGETYSEGILREVREETGYTSKANPIKIGEFMVNPAIQNNKVVTFLILEAYKAGEQCLDEFEDLSIHTYDFDELDELIKMNKIKTQLFTVHAYYTVKDYLKHE